MDMGTMGATPVYNVGGNDDGMFGGGGGSWIFFLFFLLAWGGEGGLFGGRGGSPALNQLNNDFIYTNLNNSIQRGFDQSLYQSQNIQNAINGVSEGICQSTYALDNTLTNGFNTLQNGQFQLERTIDNCCCTTNRNIDAVRYEGAKNTCDIITASNVNTRDIIENANHNTQRLIDIFTQNEIQGLRDQLQSAQLALQNNAQTDSLLRQLRPFPQPAYITCSPYTSNPNCGC